MESIFAFVGLLGGCVPQSVFPFVQSAYIAQYAPTVDAHWALTPDGKQVTVDGLKQIDLATGNLSTPFKDYMSLSWNEEHNPLRPLAWSSDGRYLAIKARLAQVALLDRQGHTIDVIPQPIMPYFSWSPFGSERAIVLRYSPGRNFYDVQNRKLIPYQYKDEFLEKVQNVGGRGYYLWIVDSDIPIASVNWANSRSVNIVKLRAGEHEDVMVDYASSVAVYTSSSFNIIVDSIFDPTGEYLLVLEWNCAKDGQSMCSADPREWHIRNVTDSFLILIQLKTGKYQLLYSLSQITPEHIVATGIEWSADGSTILISRQDAPPVVLKVKYP